MIPWVIHYCWFGGRPLPDSVEACIRSWRIHCPDFEIRRWDEQNVDVTACRFSREAAERGEWAFVSDYARLRIVHDCGGVYFDTDVELIKPLHEVLDYEAFFGFQDARTINTGHGFGAMPQHPVVGSLLEGYESAAFLDPTGRPDRTPCPVRDAAVFGRLGFRLDGTRQQRAGVVILPSDYFCPKSYESGRIRITDRTIAIHHFEASWHGDAEAADLAARRRYARLFGPAVGRWLHRGEIRARNLMIKVGRLLGVSRT